MAQDLIQPLRAVVSVALDPRRGQQLGPHQFWMARRYEMTLECGHVHARIRDAYHGERPEHLRPPLPRRVRCAECAGCPECAGCACRGDALGGDGHQRGRR